jgi:hypothetical protein
VLNDNIVKLIQPGTVNGPLTGILRNGAQALLVRAVEAEVADFLAKHFGLVRLTELGCDQTRVTREVLPESRMREICTSGSMGGERKRGQG